MVDIIFFVIILIYCIAFRYFVLHLRNMNVNDENDNSDDSEEDNDDDNSEEDNNDNDDKID